MRIETLRERIENAKAKIQKKENTIAKKMATIEKKENKLVSLGFRRDATVDETRDTNDAVWIVWDLKSLRNDIDRIGREIAETRANLEKYEKQMTGELEREAILVKEIPESMRRMQTELVDQWDVWDRNRRDLIKSDRASMTYKEFMQKYNRADYEFMYKTDDQIHKSNEQDAKALIIDLYNRVKAVTGEVTDWHGIEAEVGTHGFTVLNGIVIGKEGRAEVESILAGGYNIQRLHVRVLVKPY